MLYDAMSGKIINKIPYNDKHDLILARLDDIEVEAIRQKLNSMIDGDEIHTSGWMPGEDWNGSVFQPIFDKAALKNFNMAAMMFGLLVWEVFMKREEEWFTGKFEVNGREIGSRTYFKSKK